MFQKFIRIITWGIIIGCTNLSASDASCSTSLTLAFSDANWEAIPSPGEVSVDEVMSLGEGSIEIRDHEWRLGSFDNDDLRAVIADGKFELRPLMDEDLFAYQPFSVDSEGYIRYELFLVSLTKTMPPEDGDEEEFALNAQLPIMTKLNDAELANPIVKAVQSNLSFEEQSNLYRRNPEEFKRTQGIKKVRDLLIFLRPERVAEFEKALAKEID